MKRFAIFLVSALALQGCHMLASLSTVQADEMPASSRQVGTHPGGIGTPAYHGTLVPKAGHELALFAMGCFWGSEGTYRKVHGVTATAVGFSGGTTANPSYEQVCTGATHHAETVLVEYDPKQVTYGQLLEVFWASHDPSEFNRQGPDIGEQYRSVIFFRSPQQKLLAQQTLAREQKTMDQKIVTQIIPAGPFYLAEDYHQQYDEKTGRNTCPPPRRAVNGVKMRG